MFLSETAESAFTLDIDSIKAMFDGFDPASLLPKIDSIVDLLQTVCVLAVLIAPLVLLGLGISYLLLAPKEANHYFGYRTVFGMGSVSAWRQTQKLAGWIFTGLGAVLFLFMLMMATTFGSLDAMDMVWRALRCLAWQAGLALTAILVINLTAFLRFDYKGKRRGRKAAR